MVFGLAVFSVTTASFAEPIDTTTLKQTPWAPTFPRDHTRETITAADWVGPDGIIYPNWTWAGVHTGEPGKRVRGIPSRTDIFADIPAELAGKENGEVFTERMVTLLRECGEAGGGVVRLPAGTFTLTRPVVIPHDRVVIRGAGRGKAIEPGGRNDAQETRIRFDFRFGEPGAPVTRVLSFPDSDHVSRQSRIVIYAQAFSEGSTLASRQPGGKRSHIEAVYITVTPEGGSRVRHAVTRRPADAEKTDRRTALSGDGPLMAVWLRGEDMPELAGKKRVTFDVEVLRRWREGDETKEERVKGEPVTFACDRFSEALPGRLANLGWSPITSAFTFVAGPMPSRNQRNWISRDARRGDTVVNLEVSDVRDARRRGLEPGAMVRLTALNSRSWADAIERDGGGGVPRNQHFTILDVRKGARGGVDVELEQPLQMNFPFNEGEVEERVPGTRERQFTGTRSTHLEVRAPVVECGVEDLVLEQTANIWFNGLEFFDVSNCWIRNVRVERPGRNPVLMRGFMNEVRDSEFIDPRWSNNTGQGSGYVSGSSSILIDNVYARNCRHAPNFGGELGGVVRNSRFFSSDMQWHNEWGVAHLFENCTVDALQGTGSYGYAAFAQRNTADIHGPGMGPRNTIYNCDLIGPLGGIFLGGKTENPLILHNRVRAWSGPGLVLRYHVFNGIFLGNVFVLQDRFAPGVLFGDPMQFKGVFSRLARPEGGETPPLHPGLGGANPGNDFIANTIYGGNGVPFDGDWRFDRVRSEWRRSYGNRVLPWTPEPPRPRPAMVSVYDTQLAHPRGFPPASPATALYMPDAPVGLPKYVSERADGRLVVQITFRPEKREAGEDRAQWSGAEPDAGWLDDNGQAFGKRADGFRYGWVNGRPHRLYLDPMAWWKEYDVRYRTYAEWTDSNNLSPVSDWERNQDLAWQIELQPGRYNVFFAAGAPSAPARFTSSEEPLPFIQQNDFLLNEVVLKDPGQSDVRRDAFWTSVEVGADRLLKLRPAPTAITPRAAFIQIYRAP